MAAAAAPTSSSVDAPQHVVLEVEARPTLSAEAVGDGSSCVLAALLTYYTCESVLSCVVLGVTYSEPCDVPLRLWLAVLTGRVLVAVPIAVMRFWAVRRDHPSPALTVVSRVFRLFVVAWLIVAKTWLFTASTCKETAPVLYTWNYALFVVIFSYLASPLLLLVCLCLCLPVVLFMMRLFSLGERGASSTMIQRLPTRQHQHVGDKDDPACAICLTEFSTGETIRVLPCQHEFHRDCVDKWLRLKKECPLCRSEIDAPEALHRQKQRNDADIGAVSIQPDAST